MSRPENTINCSGRIVANSVYMQAMNDICRARNGAKSVDCIFDERRFVFTFDDLEDGVVGIELHKYVNNPSNADRESAMPAETTEEPKNEAKNEATDEPVEVDKTEPQVQKPTDSICSDVQ